MDSGTGFAVKLVCALHLVRDQAVERRVAWAVALLPGKAFRVEVQPLLPLHWHVHLRFTHIVCSSAVVCM